jgi:dolichyl-phosphate-mannose-protein mannosyltransferase
MSKLKKFSPFLLLLVLAFLTRFLFLSYPAEVVFDEVHFGKFVSAYFNHQYYFDIHPPLGKLMIAGFAKILGYKGNFDFSQIGEAFNAESLFVLRFSPAFFGSLFVILIYGIIISLGLSRKAAFLGSFLVLFDNSFLVQSKFILVDIFLLFFGFASIYLFILAEKSKNSSKKRVLFYIVSAVFAGLSFSIKWTGLSFLGIILFFIFLNSIKQFKFKDFLQKIIIFTIFPFLVYLSVFAVHFTLLKNAGTGDAFMSPSFQKTLSGSQISANIKPSSFWNKFTELNIAMYKYNAGITASHPNSSKWYEWPLTKKSIWYWVKNLDGKIANIYLLGNPLIWLIVLLAVLASLFLILFRKLRRKLSPLIYFLILGYFLNLLPFILISRVTFLYHYLPSLIFGILILVIIYDKLLNKLPFSLYLGFLIAVFLLFLFLSPLTYGFPTSLQTHQMYQELFF